MSAAVLAVRDLAARAGEAELLAGVDLDLRAGGVLAVVGPSGSGKSTLGLALLGEAAPGVTLAGSVRVGGTELLGGAGAAGRVGHLPQHPGAVLDPLRRVGAVLDELAALVHGADRAARSVAVRAALAAARLPDGELSRRFPHQLSGGQQQRVALAMTLVTRPDVVVLDEPTTGLDPETTRALVESLAGIAASGVALVLLTHDHDVARALAGEALAVRAGRVEARGPADEVLDALDALGAPPAPPPAAAEHPRLRARDLTVVAGDGRAILDGVDLDADAGAAVAVVGPSGAGKTTLARALAGLAVPRSGTVEVDGAVLRPDALDRDAAGRRAVQYVHQDPRSTFAAHRPVLEQVARPAVRLRGLGVDAARDGALAVLDTLGVDEATARRRPRALSGGQLQRAAVARALLAGPAVIVADEATSALDADHRAGLVAVVDEVRATHGTTLVLVSHDLELVGQVSGTTVVLGAGRVVDRGPTAAVLARSAPRVALG